MSYVQYINKILHKKFHKMLFFPVYYGIIVVSKPNI